MYNDGWPYLTRGRAVALMLALIGLAWMMLQVARPADPRVSMWQGQGLFASKRAAPAANQSQGLTGITMQQVGRGLEINGPKPQGDPVGSVNAVVTQGYGVGSHAPAEVWGAIDLALDGDGDGQADPSGTLGQPVYATHSGVIKLAANTWPAGNHIWVTNDKYRTGYSHLQDFAVEDGQEVQTGTVIGHIGSTGAASGPHLDYQVWEMVDGAWVNQNPFDYGGADGAK